MGSGGRRLDDIHETHRAPGTDALCATGQAPKGQGALTQHLAPCAMLRAQGPSTWTPHGWYDCAHFTDTETGLARPPNSLKGTQLKATSPAKRPTSAIPAPSSCTTSWPRHSVNKQLMWTDVLQSPGWGALAPNHRAFFKLQTSTQKVTEPILLPTSSICF